MTACILHPDDEHQPEPGWQCCLRAHDRMLAALRDIPVLVDELSGLGYVERDTRRGRRAVAVAYEIATRRPHAVYEDGPADPVAHVLTAGPVTGTRSGPRVGGSTDRPVPIRIDSTDLLAPARPASFAVAERGLYAADQVGHLAVATELEFWARDWADARGEGCPYPTVRVLAGWLTDRLDWACASHPALDEFAVKLRELRGTLSAATGRTPPAVEWMEAECPGCHQLALYRDRDAERIACGGCSVLLTDDEYAEHVRRLIDEA